MSFSYDPGTPVGLIRLMIDDTQAQYAAFQDEELLAYLNLEGGSSVKLAASDALMTLAKNRVWIAQKITMLDLVTDGPSVAAEMRAQAKELRRQALEEDPNGQFDWAEQVGNAFSERDRIYKQFLRGAI